MRDEVPSIPWTQYSVVAFSLVLASCSPPPPQAPKPATARGERLFLSCSACHSLTGTTSPSTSIGPDLLGVFGRKAGSLEGYAYSPAMKSQTFVWNEETLDRWLTDPGAVVPGTSMAYAGMQDAQSRAELIAYLKQANQDHAD